MVKRKRDASNEKGQEEETEDEAKEKEDGKEETEEEEERQMHRRRRTWTPKLPACHVQGSGSRCVLRKVRWR